MDSDENRIEGAGLGERGLGDEFAAVTKKGCGSRPCLLPRQLEQSKFQALAWTLFVI